MGNAVTDPLSPDGYYSKELSNWEQFMRGSYGITQEEQAKALLAVLMRYYFYGGQGSGRMTAKLNALGKTFDEAAMKYFRVAISPRAGDTEVRFKAAPMGYRMLSGLMANLPDALQNLPGIQKNQKALSVALDAYSMTGIATELIGEMPDYGMLHLGTLYPDLSTPDVEQEITNPEPLSLSNPEHRIEVRKALVHGATERLLNSMDDWRTQLANSRTDARVLHAQITHALYLITGEAKAALRTIEEFLIESGQPLMKKRGKVRLTEARLGYARVFYMNKGLGLTPVAIGEILMKESWKDASSWADYVMHAKKEVRGAFKQCGVNIQLTAEPGKKRR